MPSQITCVTKPNRYSSHEAITYVGGVRGGGNSFYITRQACADDIRLGRESYFVQVGRNRIDVEAYQKNGVWFIRTRPDHTQQDNLLSLPECR